MRFGGQAQALQNARQAHESVRVANRLAGVVDLRDDDV